jgi:hypothetical protein
MTVTAKLSASGEGRAKEPSIVFTQSHQPISSSVISCTPSNHSLYQSIGAVASNGASTRFRSNTSSGASHRHFIHDSIHSSFDFPALIPWHTLSTDVNERLRDGSLRINNKYEQSRL